MKNWWGWSFINISQLTAQHDTLEIVHQAQLNHCEQNPPIHAPHFSYGYQLPLSLLVLISTIAHAPLRSLQSGLPLSKVLGSHVKRLSSIQVNRSPPTNHYISKNETTLRNKHFPSMDALGWAQRLRLDELVQWAGWSLTAIYRRRNTPPVLSIHFAHVLLQARVGNAACAGRHGTVCILTCLESRGLDGRGNCQHGEKCGWDGELHLEITILWKRKGLGGGYERVTRNDRVVDW